MIRDVITIDDTLCNGCGNCIPNCPEGAIQVIDGKARVVSDLLCDGLGACIGHCPEDAITVEKREAEPYDERKVMERLISQGDGVVRAHLLHLESHGERGLVRIAEEVLAEHQISAADSRQPVHAMTGHAGLEGGCPGSRFREVQHGDEAGDAGGSPESVRAEAAATSDGVTQFEPRSELGQWPVQLHLLPPTAPWFSGRKLLLSADCVAYAVGDFHRKHLAGKVLAIACPKLDSGLEVYLDKLTAMIDHGGITSIEVLMMQVPCCKGLLHLAQQALAKAKRKVPISFSIVGIEGQILQTETVA